MAIDAKVGEAFVEVTARLGRLGRDLSNAESKTAKSFDRIGKKAEKVGKLMSIAFTLPLLAAGTAATKFAANFSREITTVETLVGVAADRVDSFKDSILAIGPAVGRGPQELARSLFVVTSAGQRGEEAMQIVERAAKAAAIGLGDTAEIARAVTSAVQAFAGSGLDAARATDIMVATIREGNLEAAELASSLGRVLGIAAEAGLAFEDVGAFVATFTRVGVRADEAMTSLRGTLNLLFKTSKQGQDALGALGINLAQLRQVVREQGLAPALVDLVSSFRSLGDEGQELLTTFIPNIRALSGVLATAGAQSETFLQISENIRNSAGITEEAFKRTTQEASFAFDAFGASLQKLGIAFGTILLPPITAVTNALGGLANVLSILPKPVLAVAVAFGAVVTVTGPLLFLWGKLAQNATLVVGAMSTVAARAIAVVGAVRTLRTALVGLTVAESAVAVTTLGVARSLDVLAASMARVKAVFAFILRPLAALGGALLTVKGALVALAAAVAGAVVVAFTDMGQAFIDGQSDVELFGVNVGEVLQTFRDSVRETTAAALGAIAEFATAFGDFAREVLAQPPELRVQFVIDTALEALRTLGQAIAGLAVRAGQAVSRGINRVVASIVDAMHDGIDAVRQFARSAREAFSEFVTDAKAKILEVGQALKKFAANPVDVTIDLLFRAGAGAADAVAEVASGLQAAAEAKLPDAGKSAGEIFAQNFLAQAALRAGKANVEAVLGIKLEARKPEEPEQIRSPIPPELAEQAREVTDELIRLQESVGLVGLDSFAQETELWVNEFQRVAPTLRFTKDETESVIATFRKFRSALEASQQRAQGFEGIGQVISSMAARVRQATAAVDPFDAQLEVAKAQVLAFAEANGILGGELEGVLKTLEIYTEQLKTADQASKAAAAQVQLSEALSGLGREVERLGLDDFARETEEVVDQFRKMGLAAGLSGPELANLERTVRSLRGEVKTAADEIKVNVGGAFRSVIDEQVKGVLRGTRKSIDAIETFRNAALSITEDLFSQMLERKLDFDVAFEGNILDLGDFVKTNFAKVGDFVSGLFGGVTTDAKKSSDTVTAGAATPVDAAGELVVAVSSPGEFGKEGPVERGGGLGLPGLPDLGGLRDLISPLADSISKSFRDVTGFLGRKFGDLFGVVRSGFGELTGGLGSLVGDLGSGLSSILGTLSGGFSNVLGGLGSGISSVLGGISSGASSILGAVSGGFSSILSALPGLLSSALGSLGGLLGGVGGAAAGGLGAVVGAVAPAIGAALAPFTGGLSLLLGGLAFLAEGGIVRRPTLAVIGEAGPEVVAPLAELPKLAADLGVGMALPEIRMPDLDVPALGAGGIITKPTLALIGEKGDEAVIPLSELRNAIGGGEGDVIIQIANSSPEPVEARQRRGPGGRRVVRIGVGKNAAEDVLLGGDLRRTLSQQGVPELPLVR